MDVTNRYVLDFALRFAAAHRAPRSSNSDAARAAWCARAWTPASAYAARTSTTAARTRAQRPRPPGLLGTSIREIAGGRLPFPDGSFDLVVNNQVMEHVADLDAALAEIRRVLRAGGLALSIFPARDVWREGHIGIPFAHRLPRGSRLRFGYTWALRALGLGTWKEQAPNARQWAADKLAWIDAYTHYRPRAEIFRAFGRYFRNEPREADYIRFRLRDAPWRAPLARLLDLPRRIRPGRPRCFASWPSW